MNASTKRAYSHPPLFGFLVLFLACCPANAQFYAVSDLGALGGSNTLAFCINNHEQIVGSAQTGNGEYHAFLFQNGRMVDVGTLGGSNSWGYGINDHGWMVGASELTPTNAHGFLCSNLLVNPQMIDLGTLGGHDSAASMINVHGEVVGWASLPNGVSHAFFLSNAVSGQMVDLGAAGESTSAAFGLNGNHMAVGYALRADGTTEPLMSRNAYSGGEGMMVMGMGGMGATGGAAWSVNDLGMTAGQALFSNGQHHAFVSVDSEGGMMSRRLVDLGTLGGTNSAAYCINQAATTVGSAQTQDGRRHAFVITNALDMTFHMADLNDLIPTNCDWELIEAKSVNENGQIVGWGMHGGHTNGFLLTPVSAPIWMMTPPVSQIAGPGASLALQMHMSAGEPLTFQWLHDGMPLAEETNALLHLPALTSAQVGHYTVVARNSIGTVAVASTTVCLFRMTSLNGPSSLELAAPVGTRFRLEYRNGWAAGTSWQTMTNLTVETFLTQLPVVPSADARSRFFRAVMIP